MTPFRLVPFLSALCGCLPVQTAEGTPAAVPPQPAAITGVLVDGFPPLDIAGPAATARLATMRATLRKIEAVFVSAIVHDCRATFVRWWPGGKPRRVLANPMRPPRFPIYLRVRLEGNG